MHQADPCNRNRELGATVSTVSIIESYLITLKKNDLSHVMEDYNKMCYVLNYVLIYLLKKKYIIDIINYVCYL